MRISGRVQRKVGLQGRHKTKLILGILGWFSDGLSSEEPITLEELELWGKLSRLRAWGYRDGSAKTRERKWIRSWQTLTSH